MDQVKTGKLIRSLRQQKSLTQLALAEMLGVSDKAVSKWERGCGAPDISLLPLLSQALGVDTEVLLRGELEENELSSGNLNKLKFYLCPDCGNLLFSTDSADVHCCGKKLSPMAAKKAEGADALSVTVSDGGWAVTSEHEMLREHYISFLAFLTGDTVMVKKLYPEWGLETWLPFFAHGRLLWCCTKHGLFYQDI